VVTPQGRRHLTGIALRDEQAERDLCSSPRFGERVNDLANYTNLHPEQSLVAHLSA